MNTIPIRQAFSAIPKESVDRKEMYAALDMLLNITAENTVYIARCDTESVPDNRIKNVLIHMNTCNWYSLTMILKRYTGALAIVLDVNTITGSNNDFTVFIKSIQPTLFVLLVETPVFSANQVNSCIFFREWETSVHARDVVHVYQHRQPQVHNGSDARNLYLYGSEVIPELDAEPPLAVLPNVPIPPTLVAFSEPPLSVSALASTSVSTFYSSIVPPSHSSDESTENDE